MPDEKHEGLPVSGYQPQTFAAVDAVNENKALEERVLRYLDDVARNAPPDFIDLRWWAVGRRHIETGFMELNRAIFQPKRSSLPEDLPAVGTKEPAR